MKRVHLLRNFKRALCVHKYSWRGKLCVQTALRVSLGRWPCMIDLCKTSVGETDVDWERIERGWRYPGGTRFIKSKGLSVTKLTEKNGLFVTKMKEFSVGSFGEMLYNYENLGCFNTHTQKGLWVKDDKNYGTFSKEWGPRVKAPQWLGGQKECTWRRPWYVSAPGVEIHLMTV